MRHEAPGLPADWLNGWLAAIGVTVLIPGARLCWTDDGVPSAVFETDEPVDLAKVVADALPTLRDAGPLGHRQNAARNGARFQPQRHACSVPGARRRRTRRWRRHPRRIGIGPERRPEARQPGARRVRPASPTRRDALVPGDRLRARPRHRRHCRASAGHVQRLGKTGAAQRPRLRCAPVPSRNARGTRRLRRSGRRTPRIRRVAAVPDQGRRPPDPAAPVDRQQHQAGGLPVDRLAASPGPLGNRCATRPATTGPRRADSREVSGDSLPAHRPSRHHPRLLRGARPVTPEPISCCRRWSITLSNARRQCALLIHVDWPMLGRDRADTGASGPAPSSCGQRHGPTRA